MIYDIEEITPGTCARCGCWISFLTYFCPPCLTRVEPAPTKRVWVEKEDAKIKG